MQIVTKSFASKVLLIEYMLKFVMYLTHATDYYKPTLLCSLISILLLI